MNKRLQHLQKEIKYNTYSMLFLKCIYVITVWKCDILHCVTEKVCMKSDRQHSIYVEPEFPWRHPSVTLESLYRDEIYFASTWYSK